MAWPVATAYTSAYAAIRARLMTGWVSGGSRRTPIQFSASEGALAVTGTTLAPPPTNAPWLKVDVIPGAPTEAFAFCADHGTNRNQVLIYLTIYVPRAAGNSENTLLTLSGQARAIFSRQFTGDGLRPGETTLPKMLPDEGVWRRAQVQCPCWFYEDVDQ